MKFAFALLPIAAALRFVGAGPVSAQDLTTLAPVPVTNLVCDGNTYKCTASLDYGNGRWVAQWGTAVFHEGRPQKISMAPAPVTDLTCDGNTFKCTAKLHYGDGNWVAQWDANVFYQALFGEEAIGAMAPVPVSKLTCDGNAYHCTANLKFGNGRWVAQWNTVVFQHGL